MTRADEEIKRTAVGKTAIVTLTKIWKDLSVKIDTNIRIMNSLVFPIVVYGSETWTITAALKKRIDVSICIAI